MFNLLSLLVIISILVSPMALSGAADPVTAKKNFIQPVIGEYKQKKILIFTLSVSKDKADKLLMNDVLNHLYSTSYNLRRFMLVQEFEFDERVSPKNKSIDGTTDSVRDRLIGKALDLGIDEILLINNVGFTQHSIAPESEALREDKHSIGDEVILKLIDGLFSNSGEFDFPNNISSEITVSIARIDVKSGQVINNIYVNAIYVGGNVTESKVAAMLQLKKKFTEKMALLYPINDFGYVENNKNMILIRGRGDGVNVGAYFTIEIADDVVSINGDTIRRPGRQVALATAIDVSESSSRLKIVRQWGEMKGKIRTREYQPNIYSFSFIVGKNIPENNFNISANVLVNPFSMFSYGGVVEYLRLVDTRGQSIQGVSFGPIAELDLYRFGRFTSRFQTGLNFDFFFRNDDEDKSVVAANLGIPFFINIEQQFGRSWSALYSFGYFVSLKTSSWQYTDNKGGDDGVFDSTPAFWNGAAPEVDTSGWYFRLGFKNYLF